LSNVEGIPSTPLHLNIIHNVFKITAQETHFLNLKKKVYKEHIKLIMVKFSDEGAGAQEGHLAQA
jgi:hypothetical protein